MSVVEVRKAGGCWAVVALPAVQVARVVQASRAEVGMVMVEEVRVGVCDASHVATRPRLLAAVGQWAAEAVWVAMEVSVVRQVFARTLAREVVVVWGEAAVGAAGWVAAAAAAAVAREAARWWRWWKRGEWSAWRWRRRRRRR